MPTLRIGATGPYVSTLQLALNRGGFLQDAPDGIFGQNTRNGVISFQQANRLTPDGVVGPATWRALRPYLTGYVRQTIRRGDTFWALANTYNTTVGAIQRANPTLTPETLTVGSPIVIPLNFSVVPETIPYTSALLTYVIEGLTARYPFILSSSIGNSVMGYPLHLLTIGRGNRQLSFNAAHHGNEWLTTPVVLKFLEDYARSYTTGGTIGGQSAQKLFDRTTLSIVPMVNPDGVDLASGALTQGRYYQMARRLSSNYPEIPFPQGWKANINGVDLNLQYPALWERAREIKFSQGFTRPGPRDYVGTAPLTQPESIAMANFTRNHEFSLILAYHSQGEIIYYKFADYDPPRANEIGQALSDVSGYALEVTPESSGYAGYKDWFIQEYNRPGYTVEIGRGVNPLPLTQFPQIYEDNVGLMAQALRLA